ncbi:MAG: dihydroorotase [Vampirovibrionales bacterium]|nr:dihydroorotase [Vampirovibrionales bacterium]
MNFAQPFSTNTASVGKVLIKGGRVLDPASGRDEVSDVLIEDGVIKAIEASIQSVQNATEIKLTPNHWVTPGLVDVHVHLRDPGYPDKETMSTGISAAVAGGYTTICAMPNTHPTTDNLPTLQYVLENARREQKIDVFAIPAITKGLAGQELSEMALMSEHGAVGFTDDGCCVKDASRMRRALEWGRILNVPIMSHAEDTDLTGKGCMHEGVVSTRLGLPGVPSAAETVIIAREIELARMTGGHIHLTHVSAAETVAMIRRAKAEGLRVSADVTPHHLALTDEDVANSGYDPDFKMNPPLRSETDRQALIEGLLDGTIDAIATDHAPHTPDDKLQAFDHAPCGVTGLETAFGVILTTLVQSNRMSPLQLVERMSLNPAKIFNLPDAGALNIGGSAQLAVFDAQAQWLVDPVLFESKGRNCPFKGQLLTGKPIMLFSRGRCLLGADRLRQPVGV